MSGRGSDPRSGLDERGGWRPSFPGQRRPFGEGNAAALMHGAYSERELGPRRERLEAWLHEITPDELRDPSNAPAVRMLAGKLSQIEASREWLDENGYFDEAGEPRPLAVEVLRWEEGARRLAHQLGFTVLGRVQAGYGIAGSQLQTELRALVRMMYEAIGGLCEPVLARAIFDRIEEIVEGAGVVEQPALPAGERVEDGAGS